MPIERAISMPAEVARLLDRGCRDCHSKETKWPWYSRIPPASWMMANDVEKGRMAMNLSDWPASRPWKAAGALLAACAAVQSGRMPLRGYMLLHRESRWSEPEKKAFCEWANGESRRLLVNNQLTTNKESEK
ncbi:MAG: heme-binding domain-containing protein [Acidobacteria bacterium]|nr:heme-binding domain-containing protein [Acidobacteriota bacterium]